MSSPNKNRNTARVLIVATLAFSQCWALSACGRRAALTGMKTAGGASAADTQAKQTAAKPNGTTPAPGATNPAAPAAPGAPSAPGTPAAVTFASSIQALSFAADAKNDVVRVLFSQLTDAGNQSVGPLTAKISGATAPTGADMEMPIGVTDYAAHLNCDKADCASAQLTLTKRKAPLDGMASVQIDTLTPASLAIESKGTPKDLQAQIAATLQSQGSFVMKSQLLKISKGATYFKVDCFLPQGAIVAGQAPSEKGRRVILEGQLGEHTTVSMRFTDSESATPGVPASQDYEGSAAYSETDKTIRLGFDGENRIKSLAFGNFRI